MSAAAHLPHGQHCLADWYGVDAGLLSDPLRLEAELRGAAEAAGAKVLGGQFHHFGPQAGVTGVLLLAESHISLHSWPEHGFVALDVFMCGAAEPQRALDWLAERWQPQQQHDRSWQRGTSTN